MTGNKSILIVSYYFPPNPSVGSRRWAKFAKYLQRKGEKVEVLSTLTDSEYSPWDDDIRDLKVERIKSGYPSVLEKNPNGIFEKLLYRFWIFVLPIFYNGSIYDRSLFLNKRLLKIVEEKLNSRRFKAIIVNGPPHRMAFELSKLKSRFPEVKFVYDFRDPWTWWKNLGYHRLNDKRKAFESEMEASVMERFDLLYCPNLEMVSFLAKRYPAFKAKIQLLEHGFDEDELNISQDVKLTNPGRQTRLIYFGTLYSSCAQSWLDVFDQLSKSATPVTLDIYSNDKLNGFIPEKYPNIQFHAAVSAARLFSMARSYDAFVLVYPMEFKDYFATKFYEMIYLRKPILYYGFPGETSKFIMDNRVGSFTNLEIDLQNAVDFSQVFDVINFNSTLDIRKYSYDRLTEKLQTELLWKS